jgi:hypothetical protein
MCNIRSILQELHNDVVQLTTLLSPDNMSIIYECIRRADLPIFCTKLESMKMLNKPEKNGGICVIP